MPSSSRLVELTQLTPGDGHLTCSVLAETQYAGRGPKYGVVAAARAYGVLLARVSSAVAGFA
jgi:hypothetical protein